MLEAGKLPIVNHDAVTDNTNLGITGNFTIDNHKSTDSTNLGNLEGLADKSFPDDFFFVFWIQHSLHGIFHFFDNLVDNAVETDFDIISFCLLASLRCWTNVKSDDEGI